MPSKVLALVRRERHHPPVIHRYRMRIPFGDTDHAGMVYYPRVFHYFHLAYEDFFHEELKLPFDHFFTDRGVGAPIVHCEVDFKAPMYHGQTIEVGASIERMGNKSWTWRFDIHRPADGPDGPLLATGTITKVFVRLPDMQPIPMEADVRDRVEAWLRGNDPS